MCKNTSDLETLTQDCCVIEYHIQNQAKDWVQEKSYKGPPVEDPTMQKIDSMHLSRCDGFLVVIVDYGCSNHPYWLLDFLTGEWRDLLENTEEHK